MNEQNKILEYLAINQAIKCQLDRIIAQVNKTVSQLSKDSEMEENQIRNVLDVAIESDHIEVVTNFIRYQIGRSEIGKKWRYGDFGEKVIEDIESGVVKECAMLASKKALEEIKKRNGNADQEYLNNVAYVKLTALYLGYLNRAFYYCKKADGWNELKRKEDNDVS